MFLFSPLPYIFFNKWCGFFCVYLFSEVHLTKRACEDLLCVAPHMLNTYVALLLCSVNLSKTLISPSGSKNTQHFVATFGSEVLGKRESVKTIFFHSIRPLGLRSLVHMRSPSQPKHSTQLPKEKQLPSPNVRQYSATYIKKFYINVNIKTIYITISF